MQSSVPFRPPFLYSHLIVIILIIALVVLIVMNFLPKRKNKVIIVKPPKKDLNLIKQEYLNKIDALKNKIDENKVSNKMAYQLLSKIIRDFIFDVTSINVKTVSLMEIEALNLPYLGELMKEYYPPEFAYFVDGNIHESITKTKEVITRWK